MNKIITDDKLSLFKTNFEMGDAYGVCSTAAETAAKTVSITGFKLRKGSIVGILFEKSVMAGATLNIQSTGAKAIWYRGSAVTTGIVPGGSVVMMMYDGTRYNIISIEGQEQYVNGTYDPRYVVYELEKDSNPQFSFIQRGSAADTYVNAMGGYLFWIDTNDNNKVYAAKLNPSSWDKFADGTEVTAAIEQATETMVHVPDCYFKGEDKKMIFGGLTPVPGGHKFDSPNWVGAYKMSVKNNIAHSRPNVLSNILGNFYSSVQNVRYFREFAHSISTDFGLANYQFQCLICALYQAFYGNLKSRDVIGIGITTNTTPMGLTKSLGDGSGSVLSYDGDNNAEYPIKLFGFEDLWGRTAEYRSGIRFEVRDDVRYCIVYPGNVANESAIGREFIQNDIDNWRIGIKNMKLGEYWDIVPIDDSGSYNQNMFYCSTAIHEKTGRIFDVGSPSRDYSNLFYVRESLSVTNAVLGARLAFYGEPDEIITGAELVAKIDA